MALIVLAHPDMNNSIANKTIINELNNKAPEFEIRDIFKENPNYIIDINREQKALQRHNVIVFQYPMYWYNMPAILKIWLDQVFSYQFAYGSLGDKLKGKHLIPSITVGQPERNFQESGQLSLMDKLLLPVQKTAEYAQMNFHKPIVLYDTSTVAGHPESEIVYNARIHSSKILERIDSVTR